MAFKIQTTMPNAVPTEYGDDADFRIKENGILVVTKEDGTRWQISPCAWAWVEDVQQPSDGRVMVV